LILAFINPALRDQWQGLDSGSAALYYHGQKSPFPVQMFSGQQLLKESACISVNQRPFSFAFHKRLTFRVPLGKLPIRFPSGFRR
jgi:hypothetical protein